MVRILDEVYPYVFNSFLIYTIVLEYEDKKEGSQESSGSIAEKSKTLSSESIWETDQAPDQAPD